jgi:PTS system cellobiose-specific IIC component
MSSKQSWFEKVGDKIGNWVENKLAPPLLKLGNQRHFNALRTGILRIIPIIIIGSIPLILTTLPFASWAKAMTPVAPALNALYTMTFGFMSLYVVLSISSELAKFYKIETTMSSIVALISFLITVSPVDLKNSTISTANFGSAGFFSAILVSIISVELLRVMQQHKIGIRMPKGVPENIAASFSALVPMFLIFVLFWLLRIVLDFNLTVMLSKIISPLLIVSDTWYAILITMLICQILWFVGIHGGSLTIWGVMYPMLVSNVAANAAAATAHLALPHVFTEAFVFTYGMAGGNGLTLALIVMWWGSRSVRLKQISRTSLIPGIFNINEPVLFGSPLILNPLMFIPLVGMTTFGCLYGYILTRIGWVSATYVAVPWTTPPLLQPYLSTGGDWRAVIAQAVLLVLSFGVWRPFAKIWDKRCAEEEALAEG